MSGVYDKAQIPADLQQFFVRAEIGLEASIDTWVSELVGVMREVRRVLRDDGTLWLNLGDSYAGGGRGGDSGASTMHTPQPAHSRHQAFTADQKNAGAIEGRSRGVAGLKPKDLIGQPWLIAFALRADGWYLRQDIVWAKPNPMPESVRDRCTKSHEYVFLLSKRQTYYYDFDAMQEPVNGGAHARRAGNKNPHPPVPGLPEHNTRSGLLGYDDRQRAKWKSPDGWDTRTGQGGHGSFHSEGREKGEIKPAHNSTAARRERARAHHKSAPDAMRNGTRAVGRREGPPGNPREKNNESFNEAMAVMPDMRNKRSVWTVASEPFKEAHFATFPPALIEPCIKAGCPVGGVVLDPFGGAGTTGLVADRLQRSALLIELNPTYVAMAKRRILADSPLFAEVAA